MKNNEKSQVICFSDQDKLLGSYILFSFTHSIAKQPIVPVLLQSCTLYLGNK
jgi:hypothetical protein